VILAGVTANLLVAVMLFYVVAVANGVNELSTELRAVVAGSAASEAGFEPGDRIVAVDGARVDGWENLKATIESHAGEPIEVTIVRDGERMTLEATPGSREGKGFLGVSPSVTTRDVGALSGVGEAFSQVGSVVGQTAQGVVRWFSPSGVAENAQRVVEAPKSGSQEDIERPRSIIGIVDIGSQLHSVWDVLYLLALFNVAIAFFNLLPLLPLDGGHAVVVLYEWAATKVTKRRVQVDYRKLMPAAVVVLAFLMFFAATIMFQDVRDIANR
jgi:RIP metalloprotease RseP